VIGLGDMYCLRVDRFESVMNVKRELEKVTGSPTKDMRLSILGYGGSTV
jgi:hypothetical protein